MCKGGYTTQLCRDFNKPILHQDPYEPNSIMESIHINTMNPLNLMNPLSTLWKPLELLWDVVRFWSSCLWCFGSSILAHQGYQHFTSSGALTRLGRWFSPWFWERLKTWGFKVFFYRHSHVDLWENKGVGGVSVMFLWQKHDFFVRLHLRNRYFFLQLSFSHGFVFTNQPFSSIISPNLEPQHFRTCTEQKTQDLCDNQLVDVSIEARL